MSQLIEYSNSALAVVDQRINFESGRLDFYFRVESSENLNLPALKPKSKRTRVDQLWENSCFEIFWSEDSKSYWELNLASDGDWQIYKFSDYRQNKGLEDQIVIDKLVQVQRKNEFVLEGSLTSAAQDFAQIKIYNPTVILSHGGNSYFFASAHGNQPDFHQKNLWIKRHGD